MSETMFDYGGFSLTGFDEAGLEWTVEKSAGWYDGPGVRSSRESKAGQDGDWPSKPQREARIVTLRGNVFARGVIDGSTLLQDAARRFAAVPVKGILSGISAWGELAGGAELEGKLAFDMVSATQAKWQLVVRLPDPLLYGPMTLDATTLAGAAGGTGRVWPRQWPTDWGVPPGVIPGAITLPNDGKATYWPRLRIDGPVPNPIVSMVETGDSIRYNGTLDEGQWLDIDCGMRRVLLNGVLSVRDRVAYVGHWLAVPEGGSSLTWTADAADPSARLTAQGYESAWL